MAYIIDSLVFGNENSILSWEGHWHLVELEYEIAIHALLMLYYPYNFSNISTVSSIGTIELLNWDQFPVKHIKIRLSKRFFFR